MTRNKSQSRNITSIDVWENEGGAPCPGVSEYMRKKIRADRVTEVLDTLVVNRWRAELRQRLIETPSFSEASTRMPPLS